jgi:hypothetical protein
VLGGVPPPLHLSFGCLHLACPGALLSWLLKQRVSPPSLLCSVAHACYHSFPAPPPTPRFDMSDPASWTPGQVVEWLGGLGLGEYGPSFLQWEVTGLDLDGLLQLEDADAQARCLPTPQPP